MFNIQALGFWTAIAGGMAWTGFAVMQVATKMESPFAAISTALGG